MRFLREHWIYVAIPLLVVAAAVAALVLLGSDGPSSGGYEL